MLYKKSLTKFYPRYSVSEIMEKHYRKGMTSHSSMQIFHKKLVSILILCFRKTKSNKNFLNFIQNFSKIPQKNNFLDRIF